ncbi:MAG: hypothetical protein MUD16_06105 [Desulfobacterales bacterium]|jgi:hypothetical protein|nr:hypothetical protein [Desulfobacterales bacterium]
MNKQRVKPPDLFEDVGPDPVAAACGPRGAPSSAAKRAGMTADLKRKAGFYLPDELLERFNKKFYQLKLAGAAVDNKSALLEAALDFALDDLDRGPESRVLKRMKPGLRRR